MNRNDIVALAKGELGYLEKSKKNWDKYGEYCLYPKTDYVGADNVQKYAFEVGHYKIVGWAAWCQSFVAWTFYRAYGMELANELLCGKLMSASTMEVKNAFVAKGRLVPLVKAQPGDLVFRSRSGGGHVGIVIGRTADGQIITIEGNSSSTDLTSWNGGAVVQHIGASWEWCCRPDWSLLPEEPEKWKWVKSDGKWYYQNQDGKNTYGWKDIQETNGVLKHWYWFDSVGAMATDWRQIDGRWYYFQTSGALEGALWHEDDDHTGALCIWSF